MPEPDDLALLRRCLQLVQEQQDEIRDLLPMVPIFSVDEASAARKTARFNEKQRCWERLEQLVQQEIDGCVESARDVRPF